MRYREFITLEKNAGFILTDSGGIQEETTYLGLPCLTLRPNTERPITITEGTNELVDMSNIEEQSARILAGQWKQGKVPSLWDGRTAERITKVLPSTQPAGERNKTREQARSSREGLPLNRRNRSTPWASITRVSLSDLQKICAAGRSTFLCLSKNVRSDSTELTRARADCPRRRTWIAERTL